MKQKGSSTRENVLLREDEDNMVRHWQFRWGLKPLTSSLTTPLYYSNFVLLFVDTLVQKLPLWNKVWPKPVMVSYIVESSDRTRPECESILVIKGSWRCSDALMSFFFKGCLLLTHYDDYMYQTEYAQYWPARTLQNGL